MKSLLIIIAIELAFVISGLGEVVTKIDKPAFAPGVYRPRY
jgi:hypothetical protein